MIITVSTDKNYLKKSNSNTKIIIIIIITKNYFKKSNSNPKIIITNKFRSLKSANEGLEVNNNESMRYVPE
jgi:hypothetical protein